MKTDYEIITFKDSSMWRLWLDENHAKIDGVWLRLYKKASGVPTVSYAEALDVALCYGWIDGQKKSYDEESFLQKFTPRRTKSMWSKRNIEHIERLTEQGLMMPTGILEVERAKEDGRWAAAYDTSSEMIISDEFLAELKKHPVAEKFFATLNKANTYAIAWRLQTAKTDETRKKRQDKIIALLDAEQKLH
ncbi:MAG: bacteriocin-protection protein YdeI/OmpD-associated family [Candidatus Saccharibacteria bacterium]|nr:bacteriocin-protection protein YdeI/OmpD-associated family [Candidatus Saccharibacteria bacterium]